MEFLSAIIVIQIINAHLTTGNFVLDENENLKIAAANIAAKCFASAERWSELLLVSYPDSHENFRNIYQRSETSNSLVFLDIEDDAEPRFPGKRNHYLISGIGWQKNNPAAVLIVAHSLKHLKFTLNSLKTGNHSIWRPESYFLIVLETACEVAECNNMLKVIWDYWILNAVILCSSDNTSDPNESGIELYTFNPYSADHSRQWETIVHETVEVVIAPGNFNHSWYIFKQRFTQFRSSEYCGGLFFDKTSNLDGYVIPISVGYSEFLAHTTESFAALLFAADSQAFRTFAKSLRFNGAQVLNADSEITGNLLPNGSYDGTLGDVYEGRSHLAPNTRSMGLYPGLGMTYPHAISGSCFASRIVGFRPLWTNFADVKNLGLSLGIGMTLTTIILYLADRSHGVVSAWLDTVRMIIANSILHTPTLLKHRFTVGACFIIVLIGECALRGRLISTLTIVSSYPNLDTLEQLKEQNIDAYADSIFKDAIDKAGIQLKMNSLDTEECLTLLERDERQRACFADCRTLQVFASNSTVIHVASTQLPKTYATFFATIHWPMTDRYSSELQTLLETGLLTKWRSDVLRKIEVKVWKVKRKIEQPHVKPTKINDLLIPFSTIIVGSTISLTVFTWEIKCGKNLGGMNPETPNFIII